MGAVYWISPPDLGSFPEDHDFNLIGNQLRLSFSSDTPRVTLLNGSLPDGMAATVSGNSVVLTGVVNNITKPTTYGFTFRVVDSSNNVADRTFYLTSVPAAIPPSWDAQPAFLGYFSENSRVAVSISATVTTTAAVTYSNVSVLPDGMSIGTSTGLITYTTMGVAPNTITVLNQTWRAASQGVSNDITTSFAVVSVPHAPVWETDPGVVYSIGQGMTASFQLAAFESSGLPVTYALSSGRLPHGMLIDQDGLIYGVANVSVMENMVYHFAVSATSPSGTAMLAAAVEVLVDALHDQVVFKSAGSLGILMDGQYYDIDVGATSTRTKLMRYGISGGQLPPGLVLDTTNGRLKGFLEHQALPRTYEWNQTAFDGVERVHRYCTVTVAQGTNGMFWGITVPLQGYQKAAIDQQIGIPVVLAQELDVMGGFSWTAGDLQQTIATIGNSLRRLSLSMGTGQVTSVDTWGNRVWLTSMVDQQQGADYNQDISTEIAVYGSQLQIRPGSVDNWRSYLSSNYGFVNAGTGAITTATATASVDAETTGLSATRVTNRGYDFYFAPVASCPSPRGTSAVLAAHIQAVDYMISDGGSGWSIGTRISVPYGVYGSPAILEISGILSGGRVSALSIVDPGSYRNFPSGKQQFQGSNGETSFSCQLIFELAAIDILSAGTGYDPTAEYVVSLTGSERLPQWQDSWSKAVPMAWSNSALAVDQPSTLSALSAQHGVPLLVDHAAITLAGKRWTGTTLFAVDNIIFDGTSTRLIEHDEPRTTMFDGGVETYDQADTTFDQEYSEFDQKIDRDHPQVRDTLFAHTTSIYDLFTTIFDQTPPSARSITEIRRWFKIPDQQISGHNPRSNRTT